MIGGIKASAHLTPHRLIQICNNIASFFNADRQAHYIWGSA
jgi:hypothetical protein